MTHFHFASCLLESKDSTVSLPDSDLCADSALLNQIACKITFNVYRKMEAVVEVRGAITLKIIMMLYMNRYAEKNSTLIINAGICRTDEQLRERISDYYKKVLKFSQLFHFNLLLLYLVDNSMLLKLNSIL